MQPPDSSPEFPPQNTPLPPLPAERPISGGSPPGGMGRPPRGPVISFDTIGEAWEIMKPNIGTWAAAIFIYYVIIGIPFGVYYGVIMASMFTQVQANPNNPDFNSMFGPTYFVATALMYVVIFVLNVYLYGGLVRMSLDNLRTGQVEFGKLFSATDVLPQLLGASFVALLIYMVGLMCCFIPGLLFISLCIFVYPLILDKKMGAMEALRTSVNALKSQMWMALAYVIVLSIISQVGVLVCCVGFFVSFPILLIALAITYRDFFPDGDIPVIRLEKPYAPLADPNA